MTLEDWEGNLTVPILSSTLESNGFYPLKVNGLSNGLDGYSVNTAGLDLIIDLVVGEASSETFGNKWSGAQAVSSGVVTARFDVTDTSQIYYCPLEPTTLILRMRL